MVVEKGPITWEDREPTPDSEEVNSETLSRIEDKLEELANNQVKLLEEIAKLKEAKGKQGMPQTELITMDYQTDT